jgi:hypothetical protein
MVATSLWFMPVRKIARDSLVLLKRAKNAEGLRPLGTGALLGRKVHQAFWEGVDDGLTES